MALLVARSAVDRPEIPAAAFQDPPSSAPALRGSHRGGDGLWVTTRKRVLDLPDPANGGLLVAGSADLSKSLP